MSDKIGENQISPWSNYTWENIDKLNFMEEGLGTAELIQTLSKNEVERGIRIFRIMCEVEKKIRPIKYGQLRLAAKILGYSTKSFSKLIDGFADPLIKARIMLGRYLDKSIGEYRPLFKIQKMPRDELEKLNADGNKLFLVKKAAYKSELFEIYWPTHEKTIKDAARELDLGATELMEIIFRDPRRGTIGNDEAYKSIPKDIKLHGNTDYPLNLIIYYLRNHLEKKVGKPKYTLILDFLTEQNLIYDERGDESTISKRGNKNRHKLYEKAYDVYYQTFWSSEENTESLDSAIEQAKKQRRLAVDNPRSAGDVLFPPWEDYISL